MIDVATGCSPTSATSPARPGWSTLDTARLAVGAPLAESAGAFNLDPLYWVLTGGDDNALVATFPPRLLAPGGLRRGRRGRRRRGRGQRPDAGVLVDGRPYEGATGHDHFA